MFDKYRVKKNSTRITVQPKEMFQSWAFVIDKPQWGIFGVFYGSWLDDEKNKPLREAKTKELVAQGIDLKEAKKQATEEIKHKIYGWGVKKEIDPYSSFEVGYIFYHKSKDVLVQIVDEHADGFYIVEVDTVSKKYISFYSANTNDIANFLMTGSQKYLVKDEPLRMRECTLKYEINNQINQPLATNQP